MSNYFSIFSKIYSHWKNRLIMFFEFTNLDFLMENIHLIKDYAGSFLTPKQKIFFLYSKIKSFIFHHIDCYFLEDVSNWQLFFHCKKKLNCKIHQLGSNLTPHMHLRVKMASVNSNILNLLKYYMNFIL